LCRVAIRYCTSWKPRGFEQTQAHQHSRELANSLPWSSAFSECWHPLTHMHAR
jgi:hypothetical protein